jgi:hypothetical protein
MIDRYTKIILTIIAGALVALAGQSAVRLASAQETPQFQMCGNGGCAEFAKVEINGEEYTGLVVAEPDQ